MRSTLISGERNRLESYIYVLLANAEYAQGELLMPDDLPDARFQQANSGLYAVIMQQQRPLWRSTSADIKPPVLPPQIQQARAVPGKFYWFNELSWGTESVFGLFMDVRFDNAPLAAPIRFVVMKGRHHYQRQLGHFRHLLLSGLGLVALLILAAQWYLLSRSLRPLVRLSNEINRLQQGHQQQLQQHYPDELITVKDSINSLLASLHKQQQRYRGAISDLAHSLKTPLTIIQGELNDNPNTTVTDQIQRMNGLIQRHLLRAQQAQVQWQGQWSQIDSVLERLQRAMARLHPHCHIRLELADAPLRCRVEQQDLLDMLANLLDNACKYGNGQVLVQARTTDKGVQICISDDGPGLPGNALDSACQRGVRLDNRQQGHGIGLATVKALVEDYRGQLHHQQPGVLGGCTLCLELPA